MERVTENKIVLVTQKTRLEELTKRYNNEEQTKFYVEHHGADFSDYELEHKTYYGAVSAATVFLEHYGRLQTIDRNFLPNYLFGANDLVVVIGRDGLVANTMKYLTTQRIVGVNPDPKRWDGVLLPFSATDLEKIVPEIYANRRMTKYVTFATAMLNDGQSLSAVNDLFIGQKTHASARYNISLSGKSEIQSSSGIIVSTGLGSTGWLKSIIAGADGIGKYFSGGITNITNSQMQWDADYLYFTVREPYPSNSTGASISFGRIENGSYLKVESLMPENGVIFSDGIENDYLEFNSGTIAKIGIDNRKGMLII